MQLPDQLLNSLCENPGFDRAAFIAAHEQDRVHSIRLNPFKQVELDFSTDSLVDWCELGFYLFSRPSFTLDPLFHAGCYYVQEAGSMFLEQALKLAGISRNGLSVLDLCAAPGGKSTHINSLMPADSVLVSNEVIKSRADILALNLSRWGTANTLVTSVDPSRMAACGAQFDIIVADVPCSGSGLFRKQPEALLEWSPDAVTACSLRQKRIMADILPALKAGGYLLYSTCSYSFEENEDIVKWLIADLGLEYVRVPTGPGIAVSESNHGLRFYPHLVKSEGFFCALLRKNDEEIPARKSKPAKRSKNHAAESRFLEMLSRPDFEFRSVNGGVHCMSLGAADFFSAYQDNLFFRKAGVRMGETKGRDFVPDAQLAWFTELSNSFQKAALDKETALRYLRKESFTIDENLKGLALMSYKGFGLGWAKILPSRVNNYYPNELRILK